ncbi:MAG TPA: GIY-YIG nuclease family protein [Chitinophagaceae bacterium]|nr:GIY-YIG nuclease family protein [Chitinophagaceae bacterium]
MPRIISYSVYILSNFARTVFYIGITSNLETRIWQHRNNEGGAFTSKYKCHYLMYFEDYSDIHNAIAREKQLKNWQRGWKIELIRKENPDLIDLAKDWYLGKDPGSSPG